MLKSFAEYLLEFASTSWGPTVMVAHSYLESFILPVAHELFLITVSLAKPHMSFVYALMSTTASVLGISTGYLIGRFGGRQILLRLIRPKIFLLAQREIQRYDFWAIAVACFTPIPVKVFALIAGAVHLNFRKLVIVAFFARGARYFLVSTLLFFYGYQVRAWIVDYMDVVMIILLAGIAISVYIGHRFTHLLLRKEHLE